MKAQMGEKSSVADATDNAQTNKHRRSQCISIKINAVYQNSAN